MKIRFDGKEKTPRQWLALHERMIDPPECENQHLGCSCSSKPGGPCSNEMFNHTVLDRFQIEA